MGKDLVEPDWSPLTTGEVRAILARYPGQAGGAEIIWRSPRPMSAAALARHDDSTVFVKRHHTRVRSAAQLDAEHAFCGHLRALGLPVPAILRTSAGATVVLSGGFAYEVHQAAGGTDLYRDALSWTPFTSLGHARAAGATLARLHRAAASFTRAARPPGILISSCDLITATDPVSALRASLARRPALASYLHGRDWEDDLARHLLPAIGRAAPLLAALPRQWAHGDWHPSNLTWTSAAPGATVAGVLDFGLANRTFAVHDLAIALERSTVAWLDLADSGHARAYFDAMDALLDGYQSVRPLTPAEATALPEVLPVVHLEYALAEVEYFSGVVHSPANADLAYDGYLAGHARWFAGPGGATVLAHLRRAARRNV